MEVKSKEQKTFTYTLTMNGSEVDELLEQIGAINYDLNCKKLFSMYSKLRESRIVDTMP